MAIKSIGECTDIKQIELLFLKDTYCSSNVREMADEKIRKCTGSIGQEGESDQVFLTDDDCRVLENARIKVEAGVVCDRLCMEKLARINTAEAKMLYALNILNQDTGEGTSRFLDSLNKMSEACQMEPGNSRYRSIFDATYKTLERYLTDLRRRSERSSSSLNELNRKLHSISSRLQ